MPRLRVLIFGAGAQRRWTSLIVVATVERIIAFRVGFIKIECVDIKTLQLGQRGLDLHQDQIGIDRDVMQCVNFPTSLSGRESSSVFAAMMWSDQARSNSAAWRQLAQPFCQVDFHHVRLQPIRRSRGFSAERRAMSRSIIHWMTLAVS